MTMPCGNIRSLGEAGERGIEVEPWRDQRTQSRGQEVAAV